MNITPLTLKEQSACADLLAAAFGRPSAEMNQLLHYLYRGNQIIAWGAWDGDVLAAQYSCLMTSLHVPGFEAPVLAGMSINMAVHPEYRGRGLIKQIAQPVYQAVAEQGGMIGVGFSNADGVKVDRRSKGYGYQVIGQMQSTVGWIVQKPSVEALRLTTEWSGFPDTLSTCSDCIHFAASEQSVRQRFAEHPFRHFEFGVWDDGGKVRGLVIYSRISRAGIAGAALLAAYSDDLPGLVSRWIAAISNAGTRFVHLVSSPASALLLALRQSIPSLRVPYSPTPYYLTVKPLLPKLPAILTDFSQWDCVGGDIL